MKTSVKQGNKRTRSGCLKFFIAGSMVLFMTAAGIAAQSQRENDLNSLMYDNEPQRILFIGDEKYTMIDVIFMSSAESLQSHSVRVLNGKISKAEISAPYTGTNTTKDTDVSWTGGSLEFQIKNNIRNRKTMIVRRTDAKNGQYSVKVAVEGKDAGVLAPVSKASDTDCWRNRYTELSEDMITVWSPKITLTADAPTDNSATIWIYQEL